MTEDGLALRRKRLLFQCMRRGMKESDLILGGFAKAWVGRLDAAQLDRFEALLDESDPDLMIWITGLKPPPAVHDHDVMHMIKDFKNTLSRH